MLVRHKIENHLKTERSVETLFVHDAVINYTPSNGTILDVGGAPSRNHEMRHFYEMIDACKLDYNVCDFRGGKYPGDFNQIDFGDTTFDTIMFLSSIEHFPQCTESDCQYREGYDRQGYEKAIRLLKPGGHIILTVPMGKHVWQNYHQNYNYEGLLKLTAGTNIIHELIYVLDIPTETWHLQQKPYNIDHILYTDVWRGAECVGCFVLQKPLN